MLIAIRIIIKVAIAMYNSLENLLSKPNRTIVTHIVVKKPKIGMLFLWRYQVILFIYLLEGVLECAWIF